MPCEANQRGAKGSAIAAPSVLVVDSLWCRTTHILCFHQSTGRSRTGKGGGGGLEKVTLMIAALSLAWSTFGVAAASAEKARTETPAMLAAPTAAMCVRVSGFWACNEGVNRSNKLR